MIPLSHPLVQDYLRIGRTRTVDSTDTWILFDRMQDEGGVPGIGESGGPDLGTCCWWYAKGQDEDEPALREALAMADELLNGGDPKRTVHQDKNGRWTTLAGRPRWVRAMKEDPQVFVNAMTSDLVMANEMYGVVFDLSIGNPWKPNVDHPVIQAANRHARAVSLRDLRRRVLKLYPEVVYKREVRKDMTFCRSQDECSHVIREAEALMRDGGWPVHVGVEVTYDERSRMATWRQRIAAPDLIPPEAERGPYDMPMRRTWQAGEVRFDQTMIDRILSTL